jgi:hypothetical protein
MNINYCYDFSQHGIFFKKSQSHSTFSPTLSEEINFDYILDLTIHVFLEEFHDTTTLLSVKPYPLVDLKSLVLEI